jgi:hypothetical protein
MVWQDIVISFANLLFVFSLINQVTTGFSKKRAFINSKTSVPTFIGLYAVSLCFFTMGLFISAIISFITGSLWLTIFLQYLFFEKAK